MTATETVTVQIRAAFPHLSRRQKQVARLIVDREDFVAYASAADVAHEAGVSAATVVRFCQALGYQGYNHLQAALREQISINRTAIQRVEERLANPVSRNDLLTRVFATDVRNIERTVALIDHRRLRSAADEMRHARQILVVGGGSTGAVVEFFAHALRVIGLTAQGITGGGTTLALALALLQPEDVLVGIGFWRNFRHLVEAVQQAREIGAKTIGITDNKLSPLALLPEYPFLVATDGVGQISSPVAMLSLLNAFIAILTSEISEQAVESVRRVGEAYERSDLLAE